MNSFRDTRQQLSVTEFEQIRERKIEKQHEKIDDLIRDIQAQSYTLKSSYERQGNELTLRKIIDFADEIRKAYLKIDALEVDDDEVLREW